MIVLNSVDQSEIVHIFEILHYKKQPYSKNHLESISIDVMLESLGKTKWKVE